MEPSEAELAKATLQFLKNTTFRGDELPALVAVNNWLQSKLVPTEVPRRANRDTD